MYKWKQGIRKWFDLSRVWVIMSEFELSGYYCIILTEFKQTYDTFMNLYWEKYTKYLLVWIFVSKMDGQHKKSLNFLAFFTCLLFISYLFFVFIWSIRKLLNADRAVCRTGFSKHCRPNCYTVYSRYNEPPRGLWISSLYREFVI